MVLDATPRLVSGARERFERAVLAVDEISHPNILEIYDFARDGNTVDASLELVTGSTLAECLASGPMSPRKVVEVAVQIAQGLAAAPD